MAAEPVLQKTDQDLVTAALKESNAFSALVERYHQQLLRYVLRLGCRNTDDAKDVLQETFIKAYVNLNDYDADQKFSSWIYRIAHNEAVSFFRKTNIRPRAAETEDELAKLEAAAADFGVVEAADRGLLAGRLRRILDDLDPKYREVLEMKYLDDRSYEEISDILHKPMGTVATLLNRAKRQLRREIERHDLREHI